LIIFAFVIKITDPNGVMMKGVNARAIQSVILAVFIALHFFRIEEAISVTLYSITGIIAISNFLVYMVKAFMPKPNIFGIISNCMIASIIGLAYVSYYLPEDAKLMFILMFFGLANLFFFYKSSD
jgi:hypothetical protein